MIQHISRGIGSVSSNYWDQNENIDFNIDNNLQNIDPLNDISTLPLKFTWEINKWKNLWHMSNAIGLNPTSSLKDPFSKENMTKRLTSRYNSLKVSGLLENLVYATNFRTPGEVLEDINSKGIRKGLMRGSEAKSYRPWVSFLTQTEDEKDRFISKASPGLIEKGLISRKSFTSVINEISPDLIKEMGGEKEAYRKFIKYMGTDNNVTSSKSFTSMINHHNSKTISIRDIIFGNRHGLKESRSKMIQDIADTDISKRKFSFFKWQRRSDHVAATRMYDALNTFVSDNSKTTFIDTTAKTKFMDLSDQMVSRLKRGRLLKTAGLAVAGTGLALDLLSTTLNTVMKAPTAVSSNITKYGRNDFGSGELLQNASMATERQRALRAIQESHLNARALTGSEAKYMH